MATIDFHRSTTFARSTLFLSLSSNSLSCSSISLSLWRWRPLISTDRRPSQDRLSLFGDSQRIEVKAANLPSLRCSIRSQDVSNSQNDGRGRRRVWRRRKLAKKDEMLEYKLQRIPFLEEQVRKIREGGKVLTMDIERLLLSEDNRFDFVNEVAAEAKQYVENNRDEYGGKKAILHVLSNRMNDAGFYRPEAYMEDDPYKPGPNYLREEL